MKKRMLAVATAAVTAGLLFLPASSVASPGNSNPPLPQMAIPMGHGSGLSPIESPSYAGYVLTGGPGFTFVNTRLTLPTITCTQQTLEPEVLHFVGLGGWGSDPDFAGVNVVEACNSAAQPLYFAYYADDWTNNDNSPNIPFFSSTGTGPLALNPGDDLYLSVNYSTAADTYTFKLNDVTTGITYSTTVSCTECATVTAEVMTETFQNTAGAHAPNFGTASFSQAHAQDVNQMSPGVLDQSPWTTNQVIDYGTSQSDTVVLSSSLTDSQSGSAFTNTWEHGS